MNRLKLAWHVFWSMARGRSVTVAQFQMILDTMPGKPIARVVMDTRKHRTIEFQVKLYKPANSKTKRKNAWGNV